MGSNKFLSLLISFLLITAIFSSSAYAVNGVRLVGVTTRDSSMAGATSASAKDTSIMVKNPAGLVKLGKRSELGMFLAYPQISSESKGALGNNLGEQDNDIDVIFALSAGFTFEETEIAELPVAFGFGLFPVAGLDIKYDNPRLSSYLVSGLYDRKNTLQHLRMPLSAAIELSDKLSVGMAVNIGLSAFRTDFARSSDFAETNGKADWDFAFGGGFTIGLLYELVDGLNVGLSYESETWMEEFDDYQDVLPRLDIPPTYHLGLSYQATDELEVTFDYSYVEYTESQYFSMNPAAGGFGWKDQSIYAVGLEYLLNDSITLRAGYNYGKSPIRSEYVFANMLSPNVTESHLTLGGSLAISEDTTLDFSYEHAFENTVTDNGRGDAFSQGGKGSKSSLEIDGIFLGMTKKF